MVCHGEHPLSQHASYTASVQAKTVAAISIQYTIIIEDAEAGDESPETVGCR